MTQTLKLTSLFRQILDGGQQDVIFWGAFLGKACCYFCFLLIFSALILVKAPKGL